MSHLPVFDVVIVGAGPAGSTTALSLRQLAPDLRVCLLDAQRFPRDKSCGDGLGPGVFQVLGELGLNGLVDDYPLVTNLVVSSSEGRRLSGRLPQIGAAAPSGRVVPRTVFDDRLRSAAISRGVTAITARLTAAAFDSGSSLWELRCARSSDEGRAAAEDNGAGMAFRTRVLVGADGARSTVRRLLGVPYNTPDHTAIAIRCYAERRDRLETAPGLELHFIKTLLPGYGWVFPIDGRSANLGVGVDVPVYRKRRRRIEDLLEDFLQKWRGEAPEAKPAEVAHRKTYILPYGSQLPALAHGTAALVGDAASMVNPLTGEGIYYGMVGARMLAAHLAEGVRQNTRVGAALARYEAEFRERFERHYRANARVKRVVASPTFTNIVVRACLRDRRILAHMIDLVMGEGGRLGPGDALRILATGWRA